MSYALDGDDFTYTTCIREKFNSMLKRKGYIGVTSGNPEHQNVNDIDVHSIDFFNLNSEYYQHDAKGIVEEQHYFKRDENGFVGKTVYPWSAKLNTIEMGKVAFDIMEHKRVHREYKREQFMKSLHIVKKNDDYAEVLFKMFE